MSEVILPYFSPRNAVAGAVDYIDVPHGIRGWLVNVGEIGNPQNLRVHFNGELIATSVAILDRPDIDEVLKATTQCGFLVGWSRFDRDKLSEIVNRSPDAELSVESVDCATPVPIVCSSLKASEILRMVKNAPQGDLKSDFKELNDYLTISTSGLFDADWFASENITPGVRLPSILRYMRAGEQLGARPNLYFDPVYYAQMAETGQRGAFVHYIRRGEQAGIEPSVHFDPRWYAARYGLPKGVKPLAHYFANRRTNSPNRWFDVDFYRAVSGVPESTPDIYEHFIAVGIRSELSPSPQFSTNGKGIIAPTPEAADFLEEVRRCSETLTPILTRFGRSNNEASLPSLDAPAKQTGGKAPKKARARKPIKSPAEILGDVSVILGSTYAKTSEFLQAKSESELRHIAAAGEELLFAEPPLRAQAAVMLAVAYRLLGDPLASARAQTTYLLAAPGKKPQDTEIRRNFTGLNHALYRTNRGEARTIYRLLYERGERDFLTTLRLLEFSLESRDRASANKYYADLQQNHESRAGFYGKIAFSRYHQLFGSKNEALAILKHTPRYPEIEIAAETLIINRLIEMDALELAHERLSAIQEEQQELTWARLRVYIKQDNVAGAAQLLDHPHVEAMPDWILAEAMTRLGKPGLPNAASRSKVLETLNERLASRGISNQAIVQARLQFLLQQKRWKDMQSVFEQLEGTELATSRETQLKRLEYACASGQPELAERLYRQDFAGKPFTKWEGVTVLRLLGELKQWREAGEVIIAHIRNGFGFSGAAHMAIRIVRNSAIHETIDQMVRRNELPPPESRDPDLANFLRLVREDHALVVSARNLTGGLTGRGGAMRQPNRWLQFFTPRNARVAMNGAAAVGLSNAWPLSPVEGDATKSDNCCTYLCTNQRYFLSLLTFLCSYLGQSQQTQARIFIFLDHDVPKHWHASINMIAARFNQTINIVSEDEFVKADVEHRTTYGFFTGGSSLSRAAYFRIYAAQYLMKRYNFSRALYVDTDIVCRGDLSDLFKIDLEDKLISARIEDYTVEVQNAADVNGLDAKAYFNSGVLLMRFDDPRMPGYLNSCVHLCEHETERLVFHDQCALNIAFRDQNQPLAARYNFFLRPHIERNGFLEDGLLLHFLDRPKPWDLAFSRGYREEWRVWALLLSSIIPQNLYVDIFAASNRD